MILDAVIAHIDALQLNGFPHNHVRLICQTINEFRPTIICEWGTNQGNSARALYEATMLCPCPLHTIDNAELQRPPLLEGCELSLHHGDGLTFSLLLTEGQERPLILIDDHHVYQQTLDTITTLSEKRPQAVLLIHDSAEGITEASYAIRAFLKEHNGYTVTESLDESGLMRLWPN